MFALCQLPAVPFLGFASILIAQVHMDMDTTLIDELVRILLANMSTRKSA